MMRRNICEQRRERSFHIGTDKASCPFVTTSGPSETGLVCVTEWSNEAGVGVPL